MHEDISYGLRFQFKAKDAVQTLKKYVFHLGIYSRKVRTNAKAIIEKSSPQDEQEEKEPPAKFEKEGSV